MKHLLSSVLLLVAAAFAHADEFDPADNTVIPGKRVGLIKAGMTSADLEHAYGKKNVKLMDLPGPEGSTFPGAKLFEGTDRELEIAWDPEKEDKKIVGEVIIIGTAWKFDNGLKVGMPLAEVEKINGKPFKVSGFGWDYGGYANFEGGKLEGKVSVRFNPSTEDYPDSVSGEKSISSSSKQLRAVKPVVGERISVSLSSE